MLPAISKYYPKLFSLNISFNNLCDLGFCIKEISSLTELKILNLMGNPCYLQTGYKDFALHSLKTLRMLDEVKIQKKVAKKSNQP